MNDLSKDAVQHLDIGEDGAGQRLDNYLVKVLKGVPKSHIYRIVRSGEIRINSRRAAPDTRLSFGDRVRVPPLRVGVRPTGTTARRSGTSNLPVPPILFEDEALLALDKPAGLAVHGGSGIAFGVIERLRRARPEARYLELVHRLDRETSGILLVAKKRSALTALHAQFRAGAVDKRYLVLVRGVWKAAQRSVSLPLVSASVDGERRVRVGEAGREALTIFRRRTVWPRHVPPLSLLEAELKTGRTHQIRVHLTHLGFPLAGDDKYGDFAWNRQLGAEGLKRMFLHASSMRLAHPLAGVALHFESPLPADLTAFLIGLGPRDRASEGGAS